MSDDGWSDDNDWGSAGDAPVTSSTKWNAPKSKRGGERDVKGKRSLSPGSDRSKSTSAGGWGSKSWDSPETATTASLASLERRAEEEEDEEMASDGDGATSPPVQSTVIVEDILSLEERSDVPVAKKSLAEQLGRPTTSASRPKSLFKPMTALPKPAPKKKFVPKPKQKISLKKPAYDFFAELDLTPTVEVKKTAEAAMSSSLAARSKPSSARAAAAPAPVKSSVVR
jgi:hypothetical protein